MHARDRNAVNPNARMGQRSGVRFLGAEEAASPLRVPTARNRPISRASRGSLAVSSHAGSAGTVRLHGPRFQQNLEAKFRPSRYVVPRLHSAVNTLLENYCTLEGSRATSMKRSRTRNRQFHIFHVRRAKHSRRGRAAPRQEPQQLHLLLFVRQASHCNCTTSTRPQTGFRPSKCRCRSAMKTDMNTAYLCGKPPRPPQRRPTTYSCCEAGPRTVMLEILLLRLATILLIDVRTGWVKDDKYLCPAMFEVIQKYIRFQDPACANVPRCFLSRYCLKIASPT